MTPMTAPLAVDLKLSQQCSLAIHQDKKLKKKVKSTRLCSQSQVRIHVSSRIISSLSLGFLISKIGRNQTCATVLYTE